MHKTAGKKRHRFLFFTLHELHTSLILIVLISLLSAVLFMYLITSFGGTVREHSMLSVAVVMVGYASIVWFLTAFFAHRFIGPFERLRYELGVVIAGDYRKRLKIRRHDDAYIKAFEDAVNRVIDVLQEKDLFLADRHRDIYSGLTKIIRTISPDAPYRNDLAALRDRAGARLR